MAKRNKGGASHGPAKRAKVEPPGKILAGHSEKLTLREEELFTNILKLVTKEKENSISTSRQSLMSKDGSALFMEFDSDSEGLHLWLKCYTGPRVKFLVHPVAKFATLAVSARRPLMAFSDNFVDSENWRLIKSTLTQIFGAEENLAEEPDFVFAFSRQGGYVHFRSYQILHLPNNLNPEKTLRLSPLVEHVCLMVMDLPIPNVGENQIKTTETIELVEDKVFIGITPAKLSLLHAATLNGSVIHFMLDDLRDLSAWSGYGTCLPDFKERNKPMFRSRVLGNDPVVTADFPNDRYKQVIRSIIIEMLELEANELCFYKLEDSDICLKGTTVKFSWMLELHQFSIPAARSNRRRIKAVILDMFKGVPMPRDLMALLELLDCEHLTPGEYLMYHISLMEDSCKGHLITDVYDEFRLNLTLRHKLLVAEALYPHVKKWRDAVKSNALLNGVLKHEFSSGKAAHPSGSSEAGSGPSKPGQPGRPSGPSKPGNVLTLKPPQLDPLGMEVLMANLEEASTLISYLRHSKVHIADQLRVLFNDKNIQLRESVRVIESKLPEILHILQNELRSILGDKWFARYFPNQSA